MNNLGKVMIIDFGLATKIAPDTLLEIKHLYDEKKYQEALNIFKSFVRPDSEKNLGYYQNLYGWLYNQDTEKRGKLPKRSDDYYNNIINKLVNEEHNAIDARIKLFYEKNKENPEVYPLLPLPNAIKNNFYQGYGV
jgi:V8-like Glu-specific endopeptidase